MTEEQQRTSQTREQQGESQGSQFRPIAQQESTEDAEREGHDLGTESSAGEPAEAGDLA